MNNDFIQKFVTSNEVEHARFSCLMLALRDARMITGRDRETGVHDWRILENNGVLFDPHSFIGLINYVLILEMIGCIFGVKLKSGAPRNNIKLALEQFSLLNGQKKDIETVVALRNSLAHNYSLVNIPEGENLSDAAMKLKRHKFTIINSRAEQLFSYPDPFWEGDFSDKNESSQTKVGYLNFCDLVESVYQKLKGEVEDGSASNQLDGGIEELKARFTIKTLNSPILPPKS